MTEEKEKTEEVVDEVEETKVELDGDALKAISEKVSEGMKTDMAETIKQTVEATLASIETVSKKTVVDGDARDKADKADSDEVGKIKIKSFSADGGEVGEIEVESKFAHESKEMRFLKAAHALASGD